LTKPQQSKKAVRLIRSDSVVVLGKAHFDMEVKKRLATSDLKIEELFFQEKDGEMMVDLDR
jgi:hypothetical protein